MTSDQDDKYAELWKKKQENEDLKQEIYQQYTLLLQAFWEKNKPLTHVDTITFSPKELRAWIEMKVGNRR